MFDNVHCMQEDKAKVTADNWTQLMGKKVSCTARVKFDLMVGSSSHLYRVLALYILYCKDELHS